jgi:hypothetical protein
VDDARIALASAQRALDLSDADRQWIVTDHAHRIRGNAVAAPLAVGRDRP